MCVVTAAFCFFKEKTAYELRISDWSSDVCSSDLFLAQRFGIQAPAFGKRGFAAEAPECRQVGEFLLQRNLEMMTGFGFVQEQRFQRVARTRFQVRSEEHTSELQSLMRTSYAVF